MVKYTQSDLLERNKILQSQKQLLGLLNADTINRLIHIFNTDVNTDKSILTEYIEEERSAQKLDTSDTKIVSYMYGENKDDTTLYLQIKKHGIDFLHLSIHFYIKSLKPKNAGVIHMYKNIYKTENMPKAIKRGFYTLISVEQPINKPNSLVFSIPDGATTPGFQEYDTELQQEMDVIITVLNRLFDEDSEYYIGNQNTLVPFHRNANKILDSINAYNKIATRKNKGSKLYPPLSTAPQLNLLPMRKQKPNPRATRRRFKV